MWLCLVAEFISVAPWGSLARRRREGKKCAMARRRRREEQLANRAHHPPLCRPRIVVLIHSNHDGSRARPWMCSPSSSARGTPFRTALTLPSSYALAMAELEPSHGREKELRGWGIAAGTRGREWAAWLLVEGRHDAKEGGHGRRQREGGNSRGRHRQMGDTARTKGPKREMERSGSNDSSQFEGERLRIEGAGLRMHSIPHGIGLDFQFRILRLPKTGYSGLLMPIPISRLKYLHPNTESFDIILR